MKIIEYKLIEKFVKPLGILLILSGVVLFCLLLFRDLYSADWMDKKVSIFYNIPMIFIFFLWLNYKIQEKEIVYLKVIGVDLIVLFFTLVRLFGLMYHSGHVLFLLYSFLTTENKFYRIICFIMLLVTAYFKFFIWSDFITPTVGIVMALIFVWLRNRVKKSLLIRN